MKNMKTKIIVLVLAVVAHNCLSQPAQEVAKPGSQRRIDPRAMQMQMAILKDQDIQKVEELLKQGVDINAPIGCGTYAPLDGAVDTRNLKMLMFLLAHGAKPRGREIDEAAFIENPKTALNFVKVLLEAGVDPNATGNNGSTAISNAAFRGNSDLVVLLLAQPHIKINVPDGGGDTALMYAADNGSHGHRGFTDESRGQCTPQRLVGTDGYGYGRKSHGDEEKLSNHTYMSAEEWLNPVVIIGFRE